MNWYREAEEHASNDPWVTGLRRRAKWHRAQAADVAHTNVTDIAHHNREAQRLDDEADKIVMMAVAKAGVAAGEFKNYSTREDHDLGFVIEIETDQGWNPDPFWVQHAPERMAEVPN